MEERPATLLISRDPDCSLATPARPATPKMTTTAGFAQRWPQAIKDRRSLIGDHDLDHFFHDRELIEINSENDRDLLNFLYPGSQSLLLDAYVA